METWTRFPELSLDKTKVAVIGQSKGALKNDVLKKANDVGKHLAEKHCVLYTGGSTGYPYEAVKGCSEAGGEAIGISPAINEEHHIEEYGFPVEGFTQLEYTGKGIPERNFDLISKADAVILIGGKIGSLNEFTLAFHKGSVIGVLMDSGGVANMIQEVATVCSNGDEKENIIYSASPEELVEQVLGKIKNG